MPLNGTFPYYSDGVAGESYGKGDYKATNGRLYKVTDDGTAGTPLAWYPAPGNRDYGTGALTFVGNGGYKWASTISGIQARFLWSLTQNLGPDNASNRAGGFPLRCLSE